MTNRRKIFEICSDIESIGTVNQNLKFIVIVTIIIQTVIVVITQTILNYIMSTILLMMIYFLLYDETYREFKVILRGLKVIKEKMRKTQHIIYLLIFLMLFQITHRTVQNQIIKYPWENSRNKIIYDIYINKIRHFKETRS